MLFQHIFFHFVQVGFRRACFRYVIDFSENDLHQLLFLFGSRIEDDLQRAKDAALAKQGFSEEEVKRMKRAKAEPVTAMEKGQIIWEIDVESPSMPPEVGHKYDPDDVFCYIATPWHTYDKVLANFSGRVIEVCAKQGALVDKGEPLAYIERCEEPA